MTFRRDCWIALVSCVVSLVLSVSVGGRNGSSSGGGVFGSLRCAMGQWGVLHGSLNRVWCSGIIAWCPELAVNTSDPLQ